MADCIPACCPLPLQPLGHQDLFFPTTNFLPEDLSRHGQQEDEQDKEENNVLDLHSEGNLLRLAQGTVWRHLYLEI